MSAISPSFKPAAWFIVVGCAAAAVHLGRVMALVGQLGAAPLLANVVGWLVAFIVSFSGHYLLTFRGSQAPLARAAGRFFLISAAGFAVNELAYALALRWGGLRYDITLAALLVLIAVLTFIASRRWAFIGKPAPP